MLPNSGVLYPSDAIGVAALSMRDLEQGLCPSTPTGTVPVEELSVREVRALLLDGKMSCQQLVETYITRIAVYDSPTGLNAVRSLAVESALAAARALDEELAALLARAGADGAARELRPLFCAPLLLKDNIDFPGLPTTAGAKALAGNYPSAPAHVVRRLEAAGAIVLGKSNMGEFALFPSFTVGSLAGFTRNPYHLARSPGGSSGGSAAAVAANLALGALGTDTGNSVRGPASHAGVVGLRPSIGLVGRSGVIPLRLDRDTVSPIARSVADAAALLSAMAGLDPEDEASRHELGPASNATVETASDANGTYFEDYTRFLDDRALSQARIGVVREIVDVPGTNREISALFAGALYTMQSMGATLVDNFSITGNELGLDWDADRNGQGPALGHWNVDGHWSDLWACTSPLRSAGGDWLWWLKSAGKKRNIEGGVNVCLRMCAVGLNRTGPPRDTFSHQ